MKRNITYKKISPLDIAKMLLLFLSLSQVLDFVWRVQGKEIFRSYQSLICVFVCLALYCVADIWKNRILMREGILGRKLKKAEEVLVPSGDINAGVKKKAGEDIRYAAAANDMLEIMPGKDQYKEKYTGRSDTLKYRGAGKVILLAVSCFMILLFSVVSYCCSYGDSMEEVYRKRYLCAENEPVILYSEKVGDHEMAILKEGEKTVYGLFRKTSDSYYRAEKFIFAYNRIEDDLYEEYEIEISEEQKEFLQKISIEGEIQGIITEFYKKNKVFHQGDMECVGISYSPMVENVTVNGSSLRIEQIICQDGRTGYLWRIKPDLEESIRVVYKEK